MPEMLPAESISLMHKMRNLPTHFRCTRLTRNERERAKTRALSWICCLRSTMSNDQKTEDDQNDDVDNNDRVPQECAKCKHPIRHKAPKATCNDCGAHYHLVCTGLLRTQREEIRDGRREWSCCSGREMTESSLRPTSTRRSSGRRSSNVSRNHYPTKCADPSTMKKELLKDCQYRSQFPTSRQ